MATIKVPPPVSGGIMLSYRCPAECKHCMYACSPRWEGDWITEEALAAGLGQLARRIAPSPWGSEHISLNHGLHFTGGEPFLNYALLLKAVEIAHDLGMPSTFVETNCFWCHSEEVTRDSLQRLRAAGLKGILISANPYCAEYVPFERTERCVRLSQVVFGGNVMVYQQDHFRRFRRLGIEGRISLDDNAALAGEQNLASALELFVMGRAARQLRRNYPSYPAQRFFGQPCQPAFLRDWHNHFDNYGNLVPGYCGGISLGNWQELDQLIEDGINTDEHPVLGFLAAKDIHGLWRFAHDMGYRAREDGYVSKCDLCLDIRLHLVAAGGFAELAPAEFYAHLE